MRLYDIDHKIIEIIENGFVIDEETGEFFDSPEAVGAKLEELEFDRTAKIENIALYIKNMESLVNSIKAEEKLLADRRRAREKRIESLKGYLTASMMAANENGIETSKVCLSFRKSESVVVNEAILDKQYLTEKVTYSPDKTAIKKALKDGATIDGAYIETKQNLQIK